MQFNNNKIGYLEIITGPMFSGKTSRLQNIYKQYKICDVKTIIINYVDDTRYSDSNLEGSTALQPALPGSTVLQPALPGSTSYLYSHDKHIIPCMMASSLFDLIDLNNINEKNDEKIKEFLECSIILINECQFFNDIVNWTLIAVEKYKKCVYICGLDSDFRRNKFGNWLDLIPYCDKLTKLKSICCECKNDYALFTHRKGPEIEQKLIGGQDQYIPLCRNCFMHMNGS